MNSALPTPSKRRLVYLATALLVGSTAGCSATQPSAPERATAAANDRPTGVHSEVRSPLRARWLVGPEQLVAVATPGVAPTPGALRVRTVSIELTWQGRLDTPVQTELRLPRGVSLRSGRTSESFAPRAVGSSSTAAFEIAYAQPPQEPLLFIADAQAPHAGVHIEQPLYLQRPTAPAYTPPSGPPLRVGGVDYGTSVPLTPR